MHYSELPTTVGERLSHIGPPNDGWHFVTHRLRHRCPLIMMSTHIWLIVSPPIDIVPIVISTSARGGRNMREELAVGLMFAIHLFIINPSPLLPHGCTTVSPRILPNFSPEISQFPWKMSGSAPEKRKQLTWVQHWAAGDPSFLQRCHPHFNR